MDNNNNNMVYLVQTYTWVGGKLNSKNRGIFTTREEAERVAASYDTCITDSFVTEVELNKEYDNI